MASGPALVHMVIADCLVADVAWDRTMNATEALQRIEQTIQRESSLITSSFVFDPARNIDSRLACLELTRALSFARWRTSLSKLEEDYSACITMTRGFNTAMSMFMTDHLDDEGVPNAPSTAESQQWADSVLLKLGTLRLARRVIDLTHAQLIEFVNGTSERLRFRTVGDSGLAEDDDVDAHRWMSDFAIAEDEAEYRDLEERWPEIQVLLRKNVHVFERHYIGYDSAPELDEYFQRLAVLHARRSYGHEAFAPFAQFGGLPFAVFGAAATALVGWSLKHMAFATELSMMNQQLDIRNLLVPWSPLQWKAESLSAQLGIDETVASQVLQLFVGTHDLFTRYASIHDAPIPILVPAARSQFHFSVAGAQLSPYNLLLRRLREQYSSDYFRNVDEREAMFREDLRWILPIKRVHFADRPIVLQDKGITATDIDALALVKRTGTLGVFQLKWQDPYGGDLRERRSRLTNLVPSANKWLQAVFDWITENGPDALVERARFEEDVPKVRRIIFFVVGRYHCNFSQSQADQRAVWCSWAELLRAVETVGVVNDPLMALEEYLRHQANRSLAPIQNRVVSLHLREFTIESQCRVRDRSTTG